MALARTTKISRSSGKVYDLNGSCAAYLARITKFTWYSSDDKGEDVEIETFDPNSSRLTTIVTSGIGEVSSYTRTETNDYGWLWLQMGV